MAQSLLDQLIGIREQEVAILRKLRDVGAATADELAVKLGRGGDDLRPQLDELRKRKLIKSTPREVEGEKLELFQTLPEVRRLL